MAMVCRAHIMLERQILLPGWCLLLLAATAHKCSANLGCEAQQRGWAGADSSAGIGNVAGKDLELLRSKCRAAAVPHTQMCAKFHYFNALIMAALSLSHFAMELFKNWKIVCAELYSRASLFSVGSVPFGTQHADDHVPGLGHSGVPG